MSESVKTSRSGLLRLTPIIGSLQKALLMARRCNVDSSVDYLNMTPLACSMLYMGRDPGDKGSLSVCSMLYMTFVIKVMSS